MVRHIVLSVFFTTFLINFAIGQSPEYIPGEILVQLNANTSETDLVRDLQIMGEQWSSIQSDKLVNRHMQIVKFVFDSEVLDAADVKRVFQSHPGVSLAQFNHLVSERDIPNDALFGNQWHHLEDTDHDIDSDLAWDITTGGTTAFGDRIVACVIEGGGADWDHEDLIDNHWVNELEIPDNAMDDDDNGFIDDYDGWNATNGTDNIPGGNHGTEVSSMIGSTGNNEIGVAGVNWDVDIMQVVIGSLTEANVLAAYEYPLVMRKLYNETSGQEGAFVVVTNASWGIDFGQPDDAPLWCAMYDSLGTYGVLNCGATANNNVNIDDVGDLPTACPSDYMVSVTATNDEDIRTFSAYGITQVDLGAPGESVYMASANDQYSTSSGTSFASPCVAGAIALIYSVPCPSFMSLVHADPQAGADYVRTFLFEGVDPVDNLATEVVTGGRLNAFNSVNNLMNACSESGCLTPWSIAVDQMGEDYTVSWGFLDEMESFDLRYRMLGDLDWIEVPGLTSSSYSIEGLVWCAEYEVQVLSNCTDESGEWSDSTIFETDGCCVPPSPMSLTVGDITATSVTASWEFILAASGYILEYSLSGMNDWTAISGFSENNYTIDGLEECTTYDLRVTSSCSGGDSEASDIIVFNTGNCEDCAVQSYCEVTGDGESEWIASVEIGTLLNETGSDFGYGDYTGDPITLVVGETYDITLVQGYSGTEWSEYFKVWIDFNADGEFGDDELAFDQGESSNEPVTGQITIPLDATQSATRMRVGMDYVGQFGGGQPPEACGELLYGETEDYCVIISDEVSVGEELRSTLKLFPNPADDYVQLNGLPAGTNLLKVFDIRGQLVLQFSKSESSVNIDLNGLANGVYNVQVHLASGVVENHKIIIGR